MKVSQKGDKVIVEMDKHESRAVQASVERSLKVQEGAVDWQGGKIALRELKDGLFAAVGRGKAPLV